MLILEIVHVESQIGEEVMPVVIFRILLT